MLPMAIWAWLMHFIDLSFNIMPVLHPNGFHLSWLDLSCLAFIGGVLATLFLRSLASHPAYPQKDPRFAEAMGVYVAPTDLPPVTAPNQPSPSGKRAK